MTSGDLVSGVDVGGTTIKAAVFDSDGLEYCRSERPTPRHLGPDAVIETTIHAIREQSGRRPCGGCGLWALWFRGSWTRSKGSPSTPRTSAGSSRRYARSAEAVGLPVILDHDVRAAGLAELELGAGRGLQEVLFVALGTGVAAAVITRGQVSAGATAGPVNSATSRCFRKERRACGQRGCTETYASAAALSRRYSAASGISDVSAKDVISRAAAGDPVADGVFQDAIVALGRALVNYVLLMDPELIVVGGGMAPPARHCFSRLSARYRPASPGARPRRS